MIISDTLLFESIRIGLEPITVRVEEKFFQQIMSFYDSLKEALHLEQKIGKNFIDKSKQDENFYWEVNELPQPGMATYIDSLEIHPIYIHLTFKKNVQQSERDKLFVVNIMVKALGNVIANIDDAPINLSGIKLSNCFDDLQGIGSKLASHYTQQAITAIFNVIGSAEILGNPVKLFSNIGSGFQDLIEKPIQGFAKGPLEGGLGIVKGAGSLVSNTISGVFGSLNKVTGSVGQGIAFLAMDDEYLLERDRQQNIKPRDFKQGMGQVGKTLYSGFEQGITGTVMKPIQGAKQSGIGGFFKGACIGITGLVVKPVTGIIDATSKTAEVIQNQAERFGYLRSNEQRERAIRPFYGPEQYFRSYNEDDAYILSYLKLNKNGKYLQQSSFLSAIGFNQNLKDKKHPYAIVLTSESIIYLNVNKNRKEWIIPCDNIEDILQNNEGIYIKLNRPVKKNYQKKYDFTINIVEQDQLKNNICEQIRQLIEIKSELQ